jgi:hypothetical protein
MIGVFRSSPIKAEIHREIDRDSNTSFCGNQILWNGSYGRTVSIRSHEGVHRRFSIQLAKAANMNTGIDCGSSNDSSKQQ